METDGVYIVIGSENIVMGMVSDGKGYEYMVTPLKYMFLPDGFNNSKLAALTPVFYMYMVIMFISVMAASAGQTASPCADIQYSGQWTCKKSQHGTVLRQGIYDMCLCTDSVGCS